MATRRYKISKGETEFNIIDEVGAAVNSDTFELTIDLAANPSRQDVLDALEYFENYIISHNFPPA